MLRQNRILKGVLITLVILLLLGSATGGVFALAHKKDVSVLCLFKHDYDEDGICTRCGAEQKLADEDGDGEKDGSENVEPQTYTCTLYAYYIVSGQESNSPLDGKSYTSDSITVNFVEGRTVGSSVLYATNFTVSTSTGHLISIEIDGTNLSEPSADVGDVTFDKNVSWSGNSSTVKFEFDNEVSLYSIKLTYVVG